LLKQQAKQLLTWIQQKKEERKDGTKIIAGDLKDVPADSLPGGVSGGGNTFVNDNGTITTRPDLTLPMRDVRDTYTKVVAVWATHPHRLTRLKISINSTLTTA
jgi:hypothetical protein